MYRFIIPAIVTGLSYLLLRYVERSAAKVCGGMLPRWRRLLIPEPLFLFLIANLDGILSLLSYLETHVAVPYRYSGNEAWNSDRFFIAGAIASIVVPFLLAPCAWRAPVFIWKVWSAYALWFALPFFALLLATGVPLQD